MFRIRFVSLVALATVCVAAQHAVAATGARFAPVDQQGPALSVPPSRLAQALVCTKGVSGATRNPILLVPGTTVNPTEFAWNWEPALSRLGWPYCTIDLPGNATGDIQIAGEYMVYAIRTMHELSGRKIDIVGHSQGGMVPRWALRFWPDTRAMVSSVIGVAPSNHGTIVAGPLCLPGCAPAIWQQKADANFISALNSAQETFPGISYVDIYTRLDEVVVPNFSSDGSSSLHGGGGQITNIAVQQICPLDVVDHVGIGTYDNTAYQITMDALTHNSLPDPNRISKGVCLDPLMPGVNPLTFASDYAGSLNLLVTTLATAPHVNAEPRLACYVVGSCPASTRIRRKHIRRTRSRARRAHHHKRSHNSPPSAP
jgi:triacylglycerol esterase/lipase EstA (alpha/beta hydrolase family)